MKFTKSTFFIFIFILTLNSQVFACNPNVAQAVQTPFEMLGTNVNELLSDDGLNKTQWDKVLDKVESIYRPFLQPAGVEFSADRRWSSNIVNATVRRSDNSWTIVMYGGYARSKFSNEDALAALACHEVGHHLGETFYYEGSFHWASAEGQADYFTTAKCLREYFSDTDNLTYLEDKVIPKIIARKCQESWGENSKEYYVCLRSNLAGYQMNLVWASGMNSTFSFEKEDKKVVSRTYFTHPNKQCRLDTYVSGSLCTVSKDIAFSQTDSNIGSCNENDGYEIGLRPKCWYAK